jgi:hypothetical protein
MSLLLISIFAFLSAVSLIVILFMLPMAVQDTPQARIKRRLTTIGRMENATRSEVQSILRLRFIATFLGSIIFCRSLNSSTALT